MASIVEKLADKKIINPPSFVKGSIQYECITGSEAYACNTDTSDRDIYAFCIPPKGYVFPHTAGEILGFSTPKFRFNNFVTKEAVRDGDMSYDIAVYSIIEYFRLVKNNNPNMLDSLYVPERCVIHETSVGRMVRENRHLFLSKNVYNSFFGYAHGQLKKIKIKNPEPGSKRWELVQKYGFDVKFAYHIVRLVNECEQLLNTGDMDMERDREIYKAIRRGEWTVEQLETYLLERELALKRLYDSPDCVLPYKPDEDKLTQLLINCLEEFYGSLSNCIVVPDALDKMSDEILEVVHRYTGRR